MFSDVAILHNRLEVVCPVISVSNSGDNYLVEFAPEATQQQRDAAAVIVAAFDPVAEQAAWDAMEAGKVTAHGGALAWFEAYPNAALLFNLSIADLDLEIDDLANDLFPTASAANKNRLKLWMKTVSHSLRALAKREGFT